MRWMPALAAIAAMASSCGGCGKDPLVKKISGASELIGGRDASGRAGDFLLANDKVRFIVQDAGSSTGWGVYGGSLVDLDVAPRTIDGQVVPGDDRFGELFYQCDLRGFEPSKAEIIDDGSSDGPAILRVSGVDRGIPYLDAVLPTEPLGISIQVDYVLARDTDTLEIVMRVHDERKMGSRQISCGAVLLSGDATDGFFGTAGRDGDRAIGEPDYMGASSAETLASWALYRPEGSWTAIAPQADVAILSAPNRPFLANATIEERFFLTVGGRGDLESAIASMRKKRGGAAPALIDVEAALRLPEAISPWRSRVVLFFFDDAKSEASAFVTSARVPLGEQQAKVQLPSGRYRVELELEGLDLGEQTFDVASSPVKLELDGAQNVGLVSILAAQKATRVRLSKPGRSIERYVASGRPFPLEAGEYQLVASLGPEHELHTQSVVIAAGQTTEVPVELRRVVDTTGWIAADFHVHSTRSVDSQASRQSRVLGAIAEGLDLLTATDHDTVTDFSGVAEELGVSSLVRTVPGIEMSMLYGHINGFPLPAHQPEAYFKPTWFQYDAAGKFERMIEPVEVSAALRALGAEIVQINHPRSDGVFNYLGLDPATGSITREWPSPDTFELLNGKRLGDWAEVFKDMNILLATGKRVTATGTSDAHGELGVGYARTMIKSATDDPAAIDLSAIWRALREGRAIAMNGPFVEFTAGAAGGKSAEIGDTISVAPNEPVSFAVRVQAPSWIDTGRVVLFENGIERRSIELSESTEVVRFDQTLTASTAGDAHYMLMVEGHAGVENPRPHGEESRTVTNPIFVDRNGDGFRLQ